MAAHACVPRHSVNQGVSICHPCSFLGWEDDLCLRKIALKVSFDGTGSDDISERLWGGANIISFRMGRGHCLYHDYQYQLHSLIITVISKGR